MRTDSEWRPWLSDIVLFVPTKKGWFSYVRLALKQKECQVDIA